MSRYLAALAVGVFLAGASPAAAPPPRSVAEWVVVLKTGDTPARQDAAEALGRWGPKAAPAVPALAAAMKDRWVRWPAAQALARVGPEAVPTLVAALGREESGEWPGETATALAGMGRVAVPALTRALQDDRRRVRNDAAHALGAIGPEAAPAVPDLLRVLLTPEPSVGVELQDAGLGDFRLIVPLLRAGANRKASETRELAAWALAGIGPAATPSLIAVVKERESGLHFPTARALACSARRDVLGFLLNRPLLEVPGHALLLGAQAPLLLKAAQTPDSEARLLAIRALGQQGPAARAAVPELLRQLEGEEPACRAGAALALGKIAPGDRRVVRSLAAALRDRARDETNPFREFLFRGPLQEPGEASVRTAVVKALAGMGPPGQEVLRRRGVPLFVEALRDPDLKSGMEAARHLIDARPDPRAVGPALVKALREAKDGGMEEMLILSLGVSPATLTPLLGDREVETRRRAARVLRNMGRRARPAVPALVAALKDADPEVRFRAAQALSRLGEGVEQALPVLTGLLKAEEGGRRAGAAAALGDFGPKAKRAVPALRALLAQEGAGVDQVEAAWALVRIGVAPERPVRALLELARKGDVSVTREAVDALAGLRHECPEAGRALVQLLRAEDARVRYLAATRAGDLGGKAARAAASVLVRDWINFEEDADAAASPEVTVQGLGALGPDAAEAVPLLVVALKDDKLRLRCEVLRTLGRIGPSAKAAVPGLRQILRDGGTDAEAVAALGGIGPHAADAVPELMALLKSFNAVDRALAAAALGAIGPKARRAVPRLLAAGHDEDADVRAWAAYGLLRITGDADTYLPALAKMLRRTPAAANALARLGPQARTDLAEAIRASRSKDPEIREATVELLGRMGPSAAPALRRLLKHPDAQTRSAAARALGEVGPAAKASVPRLEALVEKDDEAADAAADALKKIRRARP